MTVTPIRDLAEHLRARLAETRRPGDYPITVRAHRNRQSRRITVAWHVTPPEETVVARLADLLAGEDATVTYDRTRMWACGQFHDDEMAAWIAHEGEDQGHVTTQCGCGAIESEGEECSDYDGDAYCSDLSERVLPERVRQELEAAGETFSSWCQPGDYAHCPACGGGGSILDDTRRNLIACPGCDRQRIFDLSQPEAEARFRVIAEQAEAWTEAALRKNEAQRRQRRRRVLP